MRILVISIGTYGDVLPFIGMAAELRRRGHDVTLASAQTFAGAAQRAGVPFESLMSTHDYETLFGHPSFWRPLRGARRLFANLSAFIRPSYEFIARNHQPGGTVVIASALAIGARVAEEALGAPVVWAHLTPIMLPSRYVAPRRPILVLPDWLPKTIKWKLQTGLYKFIIAPPLKPGLNAFRATLGLPPVVNLRRWMRPKARMLLMFPDWFSPPQPDWPKRAIQLGFPRADRLGAPAARNHDALDAFLAGGEPPVAVTFGSARFGSDGPYRAAIEACMTLGRRCLLLSQQPIDLPADLRAHAFAAQYAPLGDVLPRCCAIMHHGGVGTVALAFAAGAPQLIVPNAFDQFDHAARVRRLGCGLSLSRRRFTAARAARTLALLLASPQVAESCRTAAAACDRPDAIVEACDLIEQEFAPARQARAAG